MGEYTVSNPIVELTYDHRPSMWFIGAFFALSAIAAGIALWFYVFFLPGVVGFKTTVLIGLFLMILGEA